MRAGKGIDNFGQRPEVKMQQAADGVMVEVPVAFGRERSDALRAFESLDPGREPPAAALVPADFGSSTPQPGVVQQGAGHGSRRRRIRQQFGIKRKDPCPLNPPAVDDHTSAEIGKSSPFAVDPLAMAEMLPQRSDHAYVGSEDICMGVRYTASDHHQIGAIGKPLVAQRGKLQQLGPERLECLERVREIAAECVVLGVGDAEPAPAPPATWRVELQPVGKRAAAPARGSPRDWRASRTP